jgi:predicted ATP-dependent endonuclease of OLD family
MYISNLKIKNYRNFCNFEINLNPFTVIIGENNSGKTNLLNALGLIFSSEIAFFKKRVLEVDDIHYKSIYNFKKAVADLSIPPEKVEFPEVKIEVTMKDFNSDQEAVVADWFVNQELNKSKLTYVFANRDPKKNDWIKKKRQLVEKIQEKEYESGTDFFAEENRFNRFSNKKL